MGDLEMTRLCAEAMGYPIERIEKNSVVHCRSGIYQPFSDDAQAMALVKRFRLHTDWSFDNKSVAVWNRDSSTGPKPLYTDLNRAIVECVAQMQAAKVSA